MTLYPNIIYHADTSTEIFIDTLQAIDNTANADVVTYQSSIDGSLDTFNRGMGARQLTLNGKISEDNENTLRRQLNYLRGKQIYLMLGARNIATLARIRSFDMPAKVGTYTALTLDVECETETEGQYWEAEDADVLGAGASATDVLASMGQAATCDAYYAGIASSIVQSDIALPIGNYTMFVRAKDTNQVTNDLLMSVVNVSDTTSQYATTTVTDEYAIYTLDFEVDSADAGDTISFRAYKGSGITNTIYVDFLGFVRVD